MVADFISQAADEALAVDIVLGRAHRERRVGGRCARGQGVRRDHVRRAPETLTLVLMAVALHAQVETLSQRPVECDVCQVIVAHAGCVPVGVVGCCDRRGVNEAGAGVGDGLAGVAAIVRDIGNEDGEIEIAVAEIVPVITEAVDHA